jgi:GNAT superfamily N-acetyltransferase
LSRADECPPDRADRSASPADGALTLRPARDDHADRTFLYALFVAARETEMAAMPIDAAAKDLLLRMQYRSMAATYRHEHPNARWEVAEFAGEPVGLLITDVGDRCVLYVDIAFSPQAQGRGLATRLMRQALDEPRRLGLPARVNVLARNAASLRLCERIGFAKVGDEPPFVRLEWRA